MRTKGAVYIGNICCSREHVSGRKRPLSLVHAVTVLWTRQAEIFNMYILLLEDNGFL